jgi:lysyl-tRNA synthetase class 2
LQQIDSALKQFAVQTKRFLAALDKGLPSCSGVAVGMDRLIMIAEKLSTIDESLTIGWNEA